MHALRGQEVLTKGSAFRKVPTVFFPVAPLWLLVSHEDEISLWDWTLFKSRIHLTRPHVPRDDLVITSMLINVEY